MGFRVPRAPAKLVNSLCLALGCHILPLRGRIGTSALTAALYARYMSHHRSPLIFWLLVAATLCVDAVVFSLIGPDPSRTSVYASVAFHALLLSQLAIVCIWSAVRARMWITSHIPPIVSVFAATAATMLDRDPVMSNDFITFLAYYGFHAAFLLASLWILQRTQFWNRLTGVSSEWRFSLLQLLLVMTLIAILMSAMRRSPFFLEFKWHTIGSASGFVALSIASVLAWYLVEHLLMRLSCVFGVSVLLGTLLKMTDFSFTYAHYLIQGIVLTIWLDSGQILPLRCVNYEPSEK
jgi:hypothetical protein